MSSVEIMSKDKIFISPLCSGNISLTANVEEINEDVTYPENNKTTVEFSFSITDEGGINIPGGDTLIIDYTNIDEGGSGNGITPSYQSGATYSGAEGTPSNRNWIDWIPAFYSNGTIRINAIFMDSDDSSNKVDMTFDALMYIKDGDKPNWFPYSLNLIDDPLDNTKKMMPYPMDGIINSSGENIKHETLGDNSNLFHQFSIGAWPGFRPIEAGINIDGVKRGHLPRPTFRITCKNNLGSAFRLSSLTVSFTFNYAADGILMNLGASYAKDVCQLYCDPKYLNVNEKADPTTGADRYLWAIVDGFAAKSQGLIDDSEVVRVFGYYNKTDENNNKTKTTVHLDAVTETAGTNHPAFVYKSDISTNPVAFLDNLRMANKGLESGSEFAKVITPKIICQEDTFKQVTVTCVKPDPDDVSKDITCNPSDKDAEFIISVRLRDDETEEIASETRKGVTRDDFNRCVKTIKYFNIDTPYVEGIVDPDTGIQTGVRVKRSDINRIFYDTLYSQYEESVVLESIRGDVEPYALIKINAEDNKTDSWIPIYNGKPIQFNESLSRCTDGVRSRDLFYFCNKGGSSPNKIDLGNTPKRYRVTLQVEYGKYKGMTVHKYVEKKVT